MVRVWHAKPIYLLIALALALSLGLFLVPQTAASPDEATFYSTNSDGYMHVSGPESYSDAHEASSGIVVPSQVFLCVGQGKEEEESEESKENGPRPRESYGVFRGALFFDTSSLPDDATITSATLSLYGLYDGSGTDFDIAVVDGSVLNEPLESADYGDLRSQTVSGGAFDTAGFSTSGYNDIPLNETGMGWISKTGITKFGLRSSRDIAATEPTGDESVEVYPSEKGEGYQPKLVVTYTTALIVVGVGGEAYPVSKVSLLAPWIAAAAAVIAGAGVLVLRRRRA